MKPKKEGKTMENKEGKTMENKEGKTMENKEGKTMKSKKEGKTMKAVDKKITKIATKYLIAVNLRGKTLKRKGNDSDDFIEVSVWSLENALKEAYKLGLGEVRT